MAATWGTHGDMRNAYNIKVGTPQRKRSPRKLYKYCVGHCPSYGLYMYTTVWSWLYSLFR